jgi:hypothetical protein
MGGRTISNTHHQPIGQVTVNGPAQAFTLLAGGHVVSVIWLSDDVALPRSESGILSRSAVKGTQRMLGHSSDQVTLDRYSHLFDDGQETLDDNMDARCGAPKPDSGEVVNLVQKGKKSI